MSSPFADLLRKLLEPAKRPETISTLERQVELLGELDVALSEVRMAREKLRQEASRLQTRAPILEDQAKRALSNGREDFARTALGRRKAVLLELKALDQQSKSSRKRIGSVLSSSGCRSASKRIVRGATSSRRAKKPLWHRSAPDKSWEESQPEQPS